jgi:alcohol dehydrogenase
LLIGQVLVAHGARVRQFGRHREKLSIVERAGASVEVVTAKLPVAEFHCVVEATGSAQGLQSAVRMTRPRGTVVMKSTVHGTTPLDAAPVIVNEITLVGSRCGRFAPALRLLAQRKIAVGDMISATRPLGQAREAFDLASTPGTLKVVLTL